MNSVLRKTLNLFKLFHIPNHLAKNLKAKPKTGKVSYQSTKIRKTNKKVLPQEIFDLYAVIPESDKTLSFVRLQFAHKTFRRALVDTGACANVISQETFNVLTTNKALFERIQTQKSKLKGKRMAVGQLVPIEIGATITFRIAVISFRENFLVLPTTNSMIRGNCFYKKHDVQICTKYDLLKFSILTVQINEIKTATSKRHKKRTLRIPLILSKKYVIPPNKTILLECFTESDRNSHPNSEFEDDLNIALISSVNETTSDSKLYIPALNITDHPITLLHKSKIATFTVLKSTVCNKLSRLTHKH